MSYNVGTIDRAIRAVLGIVLILSPLLATPDIWSSAVMSYVSIAIGLVLLITSVVRFCPLYRVFGLSTCRVG